MIKHRDHLSRHYGQLIVDEFGKSPDIENLITEMDARIESLRKEGETEERRVWGNARGWFAVMLREWFRKLHKKPARDYKDFANLIRSEYEGFLECSLV